MRQLFQVDPDRDRLGNAQPLPAIWPKHEAPVARTADDGSRELVNMRWGFLTRKVSKRTGKPLAHAAWNNARGDKVATNGMWRDAFLHRRCLIPATSFREGKGRNPATDYWFAIKGDEPRPLFAFAGLWRGRQFGLPDNEVEQLTHTMVTTDANDVVRPVHPTRMPVILHPADYEAWLSGSPEQALALVRPFPAARMEVVLSGCAVLRDK